MSVFDFSRSNFDYFHTIIAIISLFFVIWGIWGMSNIDSILSVQENEDMTASEFAAKCGVDPKWLETYRVILLISVFLGLMIFSMMMFKAFSAETKKSIFQKPYINLGFCGVFLIACIMSISNTASMKKAKVTAETCGIDEQSLDTFHYVTIVILVFSVIGIILAGISIHKGESVMGGGPTEEQSEEKEKKDATQREREKTKLTHQQEMETQIAEQAASMKAKDKEEKKAEKAEAEAELVATREADVKAAAAKTKAAAVKKQAETEAAAAAAEAQVSADAAAAKAANEATARTAEAARAAAGQVPPATQPAGNGFNFE